MESEEPRAVFVGPAADYRAMEERKSFDNEPRGPIMNIRDDNAIEELVLPDEEDKESELADDWSMQDEDENDQADDGEDWEQLREMEEKAQKDRMARHKRDGVPIITILKELKMSKYCSDFLMSGVTNDRELLALDEEGLQGLNVVRAKVDKVVAHAKTRIIK